MNDFVLIGTGILRFDEAFHPDRPINKLEFLFSGFTLTAISCGQENYSNTPLRYQYSKSNLTFSDRKEDGHCADVMVGLRLNRMHDIHIKEANWAFLCIIACFFSCSLLRNALN